MCRTHLWSSTYRSKPINYPSIHFPGEKLTPRSLLSDATGGAAVACIGHGDPSVKDAVVRQMDEVSYCHSLFFSSSGAENLAKLLINSTNGVMTRAFIVSSGNLPSLPSKYNVR